jgi:single-strand DNA-binding protein
MSATITVIGNLGGDPVERFTQSGAKVIDFSVAVNNGKDKEPTWYSISVFGKRGENCITYLKKGAKVAVFGELKTNEKDGKIYLNVSAYRVDFLTKTQEEDGEYPF